MAAVNRYNSRSSYNMSESSSINEADSASQLNTSKFEAHKEVDEYNDVDDNNNNNSNSKQPNTISSNNNNDVDVYDDDDIDKHIKNYQFERNTRLTSSIRSNTKPQSSSTPAIQTRLPHEQPKQSDLQHKPSITKVVTHSKATAPVAPLNVTTTTTTTNDNKRQRNSESLSPLSPLPLNNSFAQIFSETIEQQQQQQQQQKAPIVDTRIQQQNEQQKQKQTISSSSTKSLQSGALSSTSSLLTTQTRVPDTIATPTISQSQLNSSRSTMRKFENSFTTNDEDEDIDWASSDEEIVKQEMETFERNQVFIIIFF